MNSCLPSGEGVVKDFGKVMYTLLYLKWIINKNLLYSTWNFGEEWIHVYTHTEVAQSYLTLCDPVDCSPPGCSVNGIFEYWSGLPFPPPGDLPSPWIKPSSPSWEGIFLTTEPVRKPTL